MSSNAPSNTTDTTDVVSVVAAVIIRDDGRILVTQRLAGAHLGGEWEFPGGKPETGESDEEALRRELSEELGVDASIGGLVVCTEHEYSARDGRPAKSVRIAFYRASICSGEPRCIGVNDIRWVTLRQLADLDLPDADRPLVEVLSKPISE